MCLVDTFDANFGFVAVRMLEEKKLPHLSRHAQYIQGCDEHAAFEVVQAHGGAGTHGLYSYGLHDYGPYTYGRYSHGLVKQHFELLQANGGAGKCVPKRAGACL